MKTLLFLALFGGSVCYGKEGANMSLLIARGQDICIALSKDWLNTLVKAESARKLDMEFKSTMIYWYDFSVNKIYKTQFGYDNKTIVSDGKVSGLAVDWIYSHIYWTDANTKTIEVADFEGNKRSTLYDDSVHHTPREIVLDPKVGWMFYADDISGRLIRGGMDGSDMGTTYIMLRVVCLTLDVVAQRIYSIGNSNNIESRDYNLKHEMTILLNVIGTPYAIATLSNFVYWSDQESKKIKRINFKPGSKVEEIVENVEEIPYGIQFYDEHKQPDSENYCLTQNMYCSHLCVPKPKLDKLERVRCICPKDFHLSPNGLLCTKNDAKSTPTNAYVLFGFFKQIVNISLDSYETNYLRGSAPKEITSLDFHLSTETIFWADKANIFKTKINILDEGITIIESDKLEIDVVAIDWIYDNIYWTSAVHGTIGVANLKDKLFKILAQDGKDSKVGLALNPLEAWMFWADTKGGTIWKGGMDGSNNIPLKQMNIVEPSDITINFENKKIYWTDRSLKTIFSCDYHGSAEREILKVEEAPFFIATFKGWVYWTTKGKTPVLAANIENATDVQAVSSPLGNAHKPGGLKVYHSSKQPPGANYCKLLRMNCTHLCLPSPKKPGESQLNVSCACPDSYRMMSDGFTCKEDVYSEECDRKYVVEVRIYNDASETKAYTQCSGTIISERWIVTAASCVIDADAGVRNIKINGTLKYVKSKKNWDIMRIIIHPDFEKSADGSKDIALLKIAQRVDEEMIHPIINKKWTTIVDILMTKDKITVSRNYCEDKKKLANTLLSVCGIKTPVTKAEEQLCKGGPILENGIQIGVLGTGQDSNKHAKYAIFSEELCKSFIFNYTGIKHRRIVYSRPKLNSRVHSLRVRNK